MHQRSQHFNWFEFLVIFQYRPIAIPTAFTTFMGQAFHGSFRHTPYMDVGSAIRAGATNCQSIHRHKKTDSQIGFFMS